MRKLDSTEQLFVCPQLDYLELTTVELTAPALLDIAQIHVAKSDGIISLGMDIDEQGVTVSRTDGQRLQVEINNPMWAQRQPVFTEPVASLRFERATFSTSFHGSPLTLEGWTAVGEGAQVTAQEHLAELAKMLGSFGIKKQLDTRRRRP